MSFTLHAQYLSLILHIQYSKTTIMQVLELVEILWDTVESRQEALQVILPWLKDHKHPQLGLSKDKLSLNWEDFLM